MHQGVYLRLFWLFLLFRIGSCFPADYKDGHTDDNATIVGLDSSQISDPEFEFLPSKNESSLEEMAPYTVERENKTSNLTSQSDISPKVFHFGPFENQKHGFSEQRWRNQHTGSFDSEPSSTWYGPPYFHKMPYAGAGSYPYIYGSGSMGHPYYSYGGIHGSPPYGYSYDASGFHYGYGSGEGSHPYSYGATESPPYGHGPGYVTATHEYGSGSPGYALGTHGYGPGADKSHQAHGSRTAGSAHGYWSQQHAIIDPELVLIGNILMRVRQMPLAQAWRTSEAPVNWFNKPPVYPSSLVSQYNSGYQRARDLDSNSRYTKETLDPTSEPEIQTQQQMVPTNFQ
nr:uncharacterized protein LOC107376084 [Nothobranchius furzeri]